MIVPEEILRAIVATMPAIQINANYSNNPQFGDGDDMELNRWLKLKKEAAYPLIWLLPNKEKHLNYGVECDRECQFVIATRETNKDLYNAERYQKSFKVVLLPVCENLINALKVSSVTDLISTDWEIIKAPNYTKNDKNATIDLWDALKLTVKVKFKELCNNDIIKK